MKFMTALCGTLLFGIMFVAGSCDTVPTHILYIDVGGCGPRTAAGNPIEELVVYKGDQVVWVNTSNREMTVTFVDDSIFGEESWVLAPGKRKIMTVKAGSSMMQDYTINPCTATDWPGSPKTEVGEDP